MIKLNLHEVKVRFSKCIEMVEAGETIVVLICQAIVPGMVFLTPDSRISKYPVRTIW